MKLWTDEDETVIRCLFGRFPVKTLCVILGRSVESIKHRVKLMKRLGLLTPAMVAGRGSKL
jgi:hypothetical protein